MHNTVHPEEWDAQTSLGFCDTNESPNFGQMTTPSNSQQQQKKSTCWIVHFAIPADYRLKLKESKKRNKYMELARKL